MPTSTPAAGRREVSATHWAAGGITIGHDRPPEVGRVLGVAESTVAAVAPTTDTEPGLALEDAFRPQHELIERTVADGAGLIGAKIGLMSRAKPESIGAHEPGHAWLTDRMFVPCRRRPSEI